MMNIKYKLINLYKEQKSVIKNFSFLSILQISQMLIGLIVFPYLIKVLGTNNYGIVAYSQAILGYSVLFINYGFNITGTRDIAKHQINGIERSKIFSTILVVKIIIFVILTLLILTLSSIVETLNEYQLAYNITIIALLGWVLFPDWYFQGIERMENITYVMVGTKLVSLFLIFILVKSSEDYIIAIAINCFSMLIAGVVGIVLAFKTSKGLKFILPSTASVVKQFKQGFSYFFSNVSANTKDYLNTFIIGAFFSYSEVGIYDLIIKVIKVLLIPITILCNAIFPKTSTKRSFKLNKKAEKVLLIYGMLVMVFVLFFAEKLLNYLSDIEVLISTVYSFKIMAISLPLLALTSSRGTLTLVGFNFDNFFSRGIVFSIFGYFVFVFTLYYFECINLINITFAIIFSIVIELISHTFYINKYKIKKIYE